MPSTKSPSVLQIGSGKVPNNTVTNSALTSIPGSPVSTPPTVINVVNVSSVTTLTRLGQYMVVLVDATSGNYTITLPTTTPQVGDVITFVMVTTSLNVVTIARGGSDTIQGFSTSETLTGPYQARSFVRSTPTDWTTQSDKPSVQTVTSTTALLRAGPSQVVLVDSTSGSMIVTLPQRAQIGDRITIVKHVASANTIQVDPSGIETIDGRTSTQIVTTGQALTVVRISSSAWITVSETSSVHEITDTFSLSVVDAAKEIHVLVHTSNAAWIAGTKTITLPSSLQTRIGTLLTITDVDGQAATSPITIPSGVLGVSDPSSATSFVIADNFGSATLTAKTTSQWTILGENRGLVEAYTMLARVDDRVDSVRARLQPTPMFNWNQSKVAVHAEFTSQITNFSPVEGFTAGGSLVLSEVPEAENVTAGTVGMLRCTLPSSAGVSGIGYLHWGSTPTSNVFQASQIAGFRAVLRFVTASPGVNYNVAVGFGDNFALGAHPGLLYDQQIGSNGLYFTAHTSSVWRHIRRALDLANNTSAGAVVAGNRYVLEMYKRTGAANWDGYVNGVRTTGSSSNIPTVPLNFGVFIRAQGVAANYVVDIDSLTVFTLDMGVTRFT